MTSAIELPADDWAASRTVFAHEHGLLGGGAG